MLYSEQNKSRTPASDTAGKAHLLRFFCCCLMLCLGGFVAFSSHAIASEQWTTQADDKAVVVVGNKRFTILTDGLIRMEYSPSGSFVDTASTVVVNRKLPVPEFTVKESTSRLTIDTQAFRVDFQKTDEPFSQENLAVVQKGKHKGIGKLWRPGSKDSQNLGGTARTLDGMNGGIDWNGKPLDLGQGMVSRTGWTFHDDSQNHRFTPVQNGEWPWIREPVKESGYQDWYLFVYGLDYRKALQDFTAIAGKIPVPPRYAFGYWWSRYWVYSDSELKELMGQMRDYDIPIDVLVIDMDWHLTHGGLKDIKNPQLDPFGELLGWTGYTWNEALFPEPEKFLDWTEQFNLKTALNLHPASGIPPMEAQYETFAEQYGFDTSNQDYIPYRMAEKKWAETYVDTILRPFEKQGVDFWWLDWQQFPESKLVPELSNTWWLNYVFFTDMQRQQKRPLLFHRWGGLGNHRYQIGFSGDDKISWESLKYQSYFTATATNVGYGYWSHDIGGHGSGELDKDAELYLRWLQFGVFSPIFRTHSAKISTIERRFWQYPDRFEAMRDTVKLRYGLTPYIYGAARQAYDTGLSMVRPMYYDYPEQESAYTFKHQYLFGDDFLVAPVDTPTEKSSGLASKQIWLPEGQWFEWFTGELVEGNQTIERFYADTEIPVFAKAGAIVPMYKDVKHLQDNVEKLVLQIFPGDSGQTELYEDAGDDLGYQSDQYATTAIFHKMLSAGTKQIVISATQGTYAKQLASRNVELVLPATLPMTKVVVNGKALPPDAISYDGQHLANHILLPESSIRQPLKIELQGDFKGSVITYGKAAKFARLTKAVKDLKVEVARKNWWATLENVMLKLEQIPRRIESNPESTVQYLQEFDNQYLRLAPAITKHRDIRPHMANIYLQFLGLNTSATEEAK